MREITGFDGQFDAVVICCDSLNYLKTKNDVIETFKSVFRVLKPEGILLFDVHSSMNEHQTARCLQALIPEIHF